MGCRQCDYDPCMCGARDYPQPVSPYCRECDCSPCACGAGRYMTDDGWREHLRREARRHGPGPGPDDGELC